MKKRAAAFTLAAIGLIAQASADTVNVYVFDMDYSSDPTHAQIIDPVIHVGDTVHWIWQDGDHDVRSVEGSAEQFSSGFPPGGVLPYTYDHTFTQTGTFWYYCTLHGFDVGNGTASGMAGTVTVQAVPEPATMAAFGLGALGLLRRRKRS